MGSVACGTAHIFFAHYCTPLREGGFLGYFCAFFFGGFLLYPDAVGIVWAMPVRCRYLHTSTLCDMAKSENAVCDACALGVRWVRAILLFGQCVALCVGFAQKQVIALALDLSRQDA